MKKFVFPVANGGAPFTNDSIVGILQEEQSAALEAIVAGLTAHWNGTQQAVILSGCEVTSLGASLYSINDGFVWINGKITRATGTGSTTLPAYIIENAVTDLLSTDVTNATFEDASNPILATETTTFVDTVAPGSGEYITIDDVAFGNTYRLETMIGARTGKYAFTVTKVGSTSPTVVGVPTISTPILRAQGLLSDSFPITGSVSTFYPNKKVELIDFHVQVWAKVYGGTYWTQIPPMIYGATTANHYSMADSIIGAGAINIQIYTDSTFDNGDFRVVIIG
tara:strand:+ start:1330 stop:2172 length:843 start_codon:yes stop_codon:yes gene_type:complete